MSRQRVLFVGRTRYRLPLDQSLARKWDALSERMEIRVLGCGTGSDPRFRLVAPRVLEGPRFYAGLPVRVAAELRSFRPEAVIAKSPYEAAAVVVARALSRSPAKLVVEVHGDWRTATRVYGSRLRRALSPLADAVGAFGVRRADAVRTVSSYTSRLVRELGVEPTREFAAFMDFELFLERPRTPLPEAPSALFVGVLERYKNVEGLARAWRLAAPRVRGAKLRIVGSGTQTPVVRQLVAELPTQTAWAGHRSQAEVAAALDDATCLVLPSRAEGLGRVLVEAFLRGRPAVAMAMGGVTDVVEDGVSGLLVATDEELADALVRVLTERELAERLASGAAEAGARWITSAQGFAERTAELVQVATYTQRR